MRTLLSILPILGLFAGFGFLAGHFLDTWEGIFYACLMTVVLTIGTSIESSFKEKLLYLLVFGPPMVIGAAVAMYIK